MDADAWDARYAASDLVWGVEPNRFVAAELADLPAGTALDVACGEGRNALWLAGRGWAVTGVDLSPVAVDRARQLADRAGLDVGFEVRDVLADGLPAGPFDAVVVAYLHLPGTDRRTVLRACAGRLAEGGTLLVVAHDRRNLAEGVGGPQDPAVLYSPGDVLADVSGDDGLVVERAVTLERAVDGHDRPALDVLVRARRRNTSGPPAVAAIR